VEDLIFWMILAAAYSVFIYDVAGGRLRLSSLFACFAGHLIWHFTLGRLTVFLADRIIYAVKTALRFVFRITVLPLFKLITVILSPIASLFSVICDRIRQRRGIALAARGYKLKKGK